MPLTNDEIRAIAEWQPMKSGFGRDEHQTAVRIQGIADRISSFGDLACKILVDDGLSNYFVLFAFVAPAGTSDTRFCGVEGLLIYLSSCGPVGVVGRSRAYPGADYAVHVQLQIETLVSPDQPNGRLEELGFEAIRSAGYEILSVADVAKPLPDGIEPFDYCLCPKPWNRVFHALFGNTD
jgi:hypothetical protein